MLRQTQHLTLEELKARGVYTPSLAVEYLRRVHGIVYTVDSLRNLRRPERTSNRADAKYRVVNNTIWTREELDSIKPTSRTKRVEPEESPQQEAGSSSSLMLLGEKADEVGERLSPFEERRCHLGGSTVERLSYALREAALA